MYICAMLCSESAIGTVGLVIDCRYPMLSVMVGSLVDQSDFGEGLSIPLQAETISII